MNNIERQIERDKKIVELIKEVKELKELIEGINPKLIGTKK